MSIRLVISVFTLLFLNGLVAQEQQPPVYTKGIIIDGDTVPYVELRATQVFARYEPKTTRDRRKYSRLEHNVTRAYPYARIASRLIREYEYDLAQIEVVNDQSKYMKLAEAELRAEFEAEVKDLTVSQGRILIKLIDRETGNTSYQLIKQLRSGFQAFIWQGVAKMFGTNLKEQYEPHGGDVMIESIVQRIELGEIAVQKRKPRTVKAQARLQKRKERLYRKYGISYQPTSDGELWWDENWF